MQSELAAGICGSLKLDVLGQRVARHEPSPEAHDYYMRGRYEMDQLAPEPLRRAVEDFEHAINLDPEYAVAYGSLGAAKYNQGIARGTVPGEAEAQDFERMIQKALDLDPQMASLHANLALLAMQNGWVWGRAERQIQAALATGRNSNAEST